MKIEIEIPIGTQCVNVAVVYQNDDWSTGMAAKMITRNELFERDVFYIPKELETMPLYNPNLEDDGK